MPNISFIVNDPRVTLGHSKYGGGGWTASFGAKQADAHVHHVDLTTEEEKLGNLDATIHFPQMDAAREYDEAQKGQIHYWKGTRDIFFPDPPACTVTIYLPDHDREQMLRTIADGLPLRTVNVNVDGLEYGSEPDGSGKKWDNAAKPTLTINDYTLFFGLQNEEETIADPPEPTIDTDVKMLVALRNLQKSGKYILVTIVSLLILLMVKS